jgi:hypothetical protein
MIGALMIGIVIYFVEDNGEDPNDPNAAGAGVGTDARGA